MVVGKVMRWSPWAPPSKRKKEKERETFEARVAVTRLDGLAWPLFGEGDTVAVRIWWRGQAPLADSYFGRRKKGKEACRVAGEAAVGPAGVAEFGGSGSGYVFCGSGSGYVFCGSGSGPDPFGGWELSFSVLHGSGGDGKGRKEKKLEEMGTETVNLADWHRLSLSLQQNGAVGGKKSPPLVQRKQVPITLVKDRLITEATLHVNVSFVEIKTTEKTSETPGLISNENNTEEGETSDDSFIYDPDLELAKLLKLADETEKVAEYKSRTGTASASSSSANASSSSSVRSSPEQQIGSVPKHSFLLWGKRGKIARRSDDDKERRSGEIQPSSNISPQSTESAGSGREKDPIGNWESTELISRDRQTKLRSQTFFASIDRRDESAGGESACTALVAVITDALHSKGAYTPTRSEFDTLIRQGSSEWQKLCNDASYINRFPNKHFDLDTILEAKIRPISVLPEKSFIGFFQPESFESLRGAMSFDGIWSEITSDAGGEPRIYIVSWNDHFFVLKVDSDAYYIIDTLGERLFEGCTKAYILKFEDSTEMYRVSENSEEGEGDELICRGKECCREFINRFLAAIPLREELEVEEKGMGNAETALHQRLQIEFHLTESCPNAIVVDNIDWW